MSADSHREMAVSTTKLMVLNTGANVVFIQSMPTFM
jgi:hypothetical protein